MGIKQQNLTLRLILSLINQKSEGMHFYGLKFLHVFFILKAILMGQTQLNTCKK